MLSQNQIALLINTFSQLTTNTNYVAVTKINTSYRTTQYFNYEGHRVKPLIDLYSGNNVIILQDTSNGNYYAIREDFDPVLSERTFTRKYQEERKKIVSKQEADVAVLLCCEKDNAYDFWVTYLGDKRKDRFCFVGTAPKKLQVPKYYAWESQQAGNFQFSPYQGATGGGLALSTTATNHDGAAISAGPQGANYESEAWAGNGEKGGVVTKRWDRVLTDYTVEASTYLQTLCVPLDLYSDVSWEWSDGYDDYNFVKVGGGNASTSSQSKKLYTTWEVAWDYEGGGGNVSLKQDPTPLVVNDGETYKIITIEWESDNGTRQLSGRNLTYSVTQNKEPYEFLVQTKQTSRTLTGSSISEKLSYKTDLLVFAYCIYFLTGNTNYVRGLELKKGYTLSVGSAEACYKDFPSVSEVGELRDYLGNDLAHLLPNGIPFYRKYPRRTVNIVETNLGEYLEYTTEVLNGDGEVLISDQAEITPIGGEWTIVVKNEFGDTLVDETYTIDPRPTVIDTQDSGSYLILVRDEDGVVVASDTSTTQIKHTVERTEHSLLSLYVYDRNGTNINGIFAKDSSTGLFKSGEEIPEAFRKYTNESPLSVKTSVTDVIAKIDAWVEINGEKLAEVSLNGNDGRKIIDSPAYDAATSEPGGCLPQKSKNPPTVESKNFTADKGFNAYHLTWYNTREDSLQGQLTEWVPFDFNNPDLSSFLPSPSINFLYSQTATDLKISPEFKGYISWNKDISTKDTNLQEEEDGFLDPFGVVYPLVLGFIYGFYGPIKVSNNLLNQKIVDDLLAEYSMGFWSSRNRRLKPRSYLLAPNNSEDGEPFEEADVTDFTQRILNGIQGGGLSDDFRGTLYDYNLTPTSDEKEEDWAMERVTFENNPSGGSTAFERQYLNDETANSSTVKQRGENTVDVTVDIADVQVLLKKTQRGDVEFTIHDSQRPNETTTQVFKMNPIKDVFKGYDDVKILAVAGVVY